MFFLPFHKYKKVSNLEILGVLLATNCLKQSSSFVKVGVYQWNHGNLKRGDTVSSFSQFYNLTSMSFSVILITTSPCSSVL